jgi:alpha-tubulin suppressor-like RCC1 family protein
MQTSVNTTAPRIFRLARLVIAISPILAAATTVSRADAQLAGDECSNAIVAVAGANGPVANTSYTLSANPPENNGECQFLNWNSLTRDVWWVFDAPVAGKLTLEFCASNFDTSVVVYRGSCGALERIGCDDDACAPSGPLYQSKIDNLAIDGGKVFIRVGGYDGSTGQVRFSLSYTVLGTAECWGDNTDGQCNTPATLGTVAAIAAGGYHTVALKQDGTVACWGNNGSGQCNTPASLGTVTAIAAGARHTVALKQGGTIACWGNNGFGQCDTPATLGTVTAIAAGNYHTIALRQIGTIACWGYNNYGQCNTPADLGACSSVAGGISHTIALRSDGGVRCWGDNTNGQCNTPATLGTVAAIAAGGYHTVALKQDGTVACWGNNGSGQCNTPASLSTVTAIAAGAAHTVALKQGGTMVCWGANAYGQCNTPHSATTVAKIGACSAFTVAVGIYDCDSNRTVDLLELAANDCNNNGTHDCWDVNDAIVEDCNGNLRDDTCEKQISVALDSGILGPIGYLAPQTWTIANAVSAVDTVTLRVRAHGDFSGPLEFIRLVAGIQFDEQALGGSGDCVAIPAFETFLLAPEVFNAGIGTDGAWRLDMIPASAVDRLRCTGGTWINATLAYTGANAADCDANGELDGCQIAAGTVPDANNNGVPDTCEIPFTVCPGDFDSDNAVGGSDLGALLGSWGPCPPGAVGDMDSNGVVNGADLGALLGAWGPCDT